VDRQFYLPSKALDGDVRRHASHLRPMFRGALTSCRFDIDEHFATQRNSNPSESQRRRTVGVAQLDYGIRTILTIPSLPSSPSSVLVLPLGPGLPFGPGLVPAPPIPKLPPDPAAPPGPPRPP
jgi:hypothetical protein